MSMINRRLSEALKIQQINVETALAAASYPTSGSYIDVSDYERFAFLIEVGAIDTQTVAKVQQATANNGALKDVASATTTIATDGDNKWYLIEVQSSMLDINNGYHYVTLTLTGPAGSNDYGAITFIGVNPGYMPVTQGSDKGATVFVGG